MLAPRPSIQVLATLRLFEGIDAADLTRLALAMRTRHYRVGQVIFHQGDQGGALHLIVSGAIKLVLPSPGGNEVILATLRNPAFFGEVALLDGGPHPISAMALEPADTITIPRSTFFELISGHASARDIVLKTFAGIVRRLDERVEALHFLDVPGRVASVLVDLLNEHGGVPGPAGDLGAGTIRIDARLTQGDLAGMANSSRQSVNQALAELAGEGIVRFERDGIVILAPERLASRARL